MKIIVCKLKRGFLFSYLFWTDLFNTKMGTLAVTTILGLSGAGSNDNEEIFQTHQSFRTRPSPLDTV